MNRIFAFAIVAGSALSAPAAFAASGQCIVFEHADFSGRGRAVASGQSVPWVGNGWNDRISSVSCSPRCRLDVWEHRDFGGRRERFSGDTPFVGNAWNDRISSMKTQCDGGGPGGARACEAFEHNGFAGQSRTFGNGSQTAFVGNAWNDRISSVACSANCRFIGYEHSQFGGDRVELAGRTASLGKAWNDRISAVVVQCGHGGG